MDSGIVAKNLDPTSNACDWMQDWQMSYRPQPRAPRFVYPFRALSCRADCVVPAKHDTNILSLLGRLFQPRMFAGFGRATLVVYFGGSFAVPLYISAVQCAIAAICSLSIIYPEAPAQGQNQEGSPSG
jgi:hypothetical protein